MAETTEDPALRSELAVFGRYLVGRDPGAYALSWYTTWHRGGGASEVAHAARIDRALVAFARVHPLLTRVADAYGVRFRRAGLLRRKLVLVLALIECSPGNWRTVEEPGGGGRVGATFRIALRGLTESLALIAGAIVLLPVHGACAILPAPDASAGGAR